MSGACPQCARRGWLLAKLSGPLDFCARDLSRFWDLLQLADMELIDAVGGKRRSELFAAYDQWEPSILETAEEVETVCRHHCAYPAGLHGDPLAPYLLRVRGGVKRFSEMLKEPIVTIVGTRHASDYGMEVARHLARGLAACGLTVTSGLAEGIPVAAHSGALQAHRGTLTVMAGGVEHCTPAWCGALYRRITTNGCAISETQPSLRTPRWGEAARARTLALLAELVIVVEAEERPWELACAHIALERGKLVAAVPGRLSSRASTGTNALLMNGARLVRGPQDALDLLYELPARKVPEAVVELEPRLRRIVEEVDAGKDTVAKLTTHDLERDDLMLALAELELQGLLLRGDGGRYMPCAGIVVK